MPFSITMPKLSPTMNEGIIARWHKKVGEHVDADELLIEVATDKATIEYRALDPGWLQKIIVPEGTKVEVGKPLAIFTSEKDESIVGFEPETAAEQSAEKTPVATPTEQPKDLTPVEAPVERGARILASPLAKKFAKERGISLANVKGSGPGGRIMSRDLEGAKIAAKEVPVAIPEGAKQTPLTQMRAVIAERLTKAKTTIPHYYATLRADVTELVSLRQSMKSKGSHVTINDFIIKAVALALMEFPDLRGIFTQNSIVTHPHADICVAVSVPGGLFTPIISQAETKRLEEISEEARILIEKAKSNQLKPEEYSGGSFTISNMGMFGIDEFYAIINPPQIAILSVGSAAEQVVFWNGAIGIRRMLPLSLAADHRAVDGIVGAAFLKKVKDLLEDPKILP